jgi:NAD-dependent SIR2 family protein deacetylase
MSRFCQMEIDSWHLSERLFYCEQCGRHKDGNHYAGYDRDRDMQLCHSCKDMLDNDSEDE